MYEPRLAALPGAVTRFGATEREPAQSHQALNPRGSGAHAQLSRAA